MTRIVPLVTLLLLAPMQCSRKPDAATTREETAGDGLWALAEDFKAKGNNEAYTSTLRFLVTRYPGNRRAPAARDELERLGAAPAPAASAASSR